MTASELTQAFLTPDAPNLPVVVTAEGSAQATTGSPFLVFNGAGRIVTASAVVQVKP